MFFRKNKPIVLKCVTFNTVAYEIFKIKNAKHFMPNWWKSIPQTSIQEHLKSNSESLYPQKTMRTCPGFISSYMHGAIMPLWSDLIVEVGDTNNTAYRWQFADSKSHATIHPDSERGSYLPANKFSHLKLVSPWVFYCDEPIPWIVAHPIWNNETPNEYFGVPGISNFKDQHTTNPNLFFIREERKKRVLISAGQPILHFVPLSDRKLIIECALVSETDFKENYSAKTRKQFKFFNSYLISKKMKGEQ